MNFSQYTNKNPREIFDTLKCTADGLSESQARARFKICGANEINAKDITFFDVFLRQFKSPFFYLLFFAAFISITIGEKIDGIVILVFVAVNTMLGFWQEVRAVKAGRLLKKYIPLISRVLRNGRQKLIEQRFLVPGDIVLLEAGNIIPADLRLLSTENFMVDEEILSGESVSLPKSEATLKSITKEIFEAKNIAFTGTSVISGNAKGVVITTGQNTVFGETAKLAAETEKASAYEKNIAAFSRIIMRVAIISILAIFALKLIINKPPDITDFFIFCVVLVISIVPEALPVIITFSFSRGAMKLAKNHVVVKRLAAIEDLGDIEILCTDKTGTLTQNKLSLIETVSAEAEKCVLFGLLSSSFIKAVQAKYSNNPFDQAIFENANRSIKEKISEYSELGEIPFDNTRFRNSVLLQNAAGQKILIVKGAPEMILEICQDYVGTKNLGQIAILIKKQGAEGKRTLAIAYKEFNGQHFSVHDENNLTFLGFFSFEDPLKDSAEATIGLAKKLGVQIKILTGDAPEVAGSVAKKIGLIGNAEDVILARELEAMTPEKFELTCQKSCVFARVSPPLKFRIVQALEKKFEVGYLGEGINDAPALKAANVAIAVREGADISRDISDIILLQKDLRVIVEGIQQGRNIFANITKYIKCALASAFGNFYFMAIISFFIPFLPILPIQILLADLLIDFPMIAISSDKVDPEELRKPRFYTLNRFIPLIIGLSLINAISDFVFFAFFHHSAPAVLQTFWFIQMVLTEIPLIFAIRTRHLFTKAEAPSLALTILALVSVAAGLWLPFSSFGQNLFHFVLPKFTPFLIVLAIAAAYFITSETIKLIYFSGETKFRQKFLNCFLKIFKYSPGSSE